VAARRKEIAPLVYYLIDWMETRARQALAKAMDYMLRLIDVFMRFLDDGRNCLGNNSAERELSGVALARKPGCSRVLTVRARRSHADIDSNGQAQRRRAPVCAGLDRRSPKSRTCRAAALELAPTRSLSPAPLDHGRAGFRTISRAANSSARTSRPLPSLSPRWNICES